MHRANEREALAADLERHAEQEGEILARYRVLSERLGETPAGMLVDRILTDEETHHLLLHVMAGWLKESPDIRVRAPASDAERRELLDLTRTLQQHERETIDACADLERRLQENDQLFFGALIDALRLDSEKHHRLLAAVEKMLAP